MTLWRQNRIYKPIACLMLLIMVINPAMALQYQQLNTGTDFLQNMPAYSPSALHIHISQRDKLVQQLKSQGYDVIPASKQDIAHFLQNKNANEDKPLQLAANFNLKSVYEKECPVRSVTCYKDECDQYSETKPDNCSYDKPEKTPPETRTDVNVSVSGNLNLPISGGGGNGGDVAAAMLVVIGVVVIAAVFIYAGKWIADALKNDQDYYSYWWDIGASFITLGTDAGEYGNLNGIKFSGGFVPNMHTNFGLAVELGQIDLDLLYNKSTAPTRINVEGAYWLIGPSVRWLIGSGNTENFVNNSYFHFELLGGGTDQSQVERLVVGRVGFNAGIGEHMRLGIHYGAFYLGLEQTEGIANDGDNYWNMYGLEIGYQF